MFHMWSGEIAVKCSSLEIYFCVYFHGPGITNVKQIFNRPCTFDTTVMGLMHNGISIYDHWYNHLMYMLMFSNLYPETSDIINWFSEIMIQWLEHWINSQENYIWLTTLDLSFIISEKLYLPCLLFKVGKKHQRKKR